jgi:branched-chain amino acid aminotransferase
MNQHPDWIWYDGKLVLWEAATTHVLTHSLHYGVSAIEGIRAYPTASGGAALFRLAEHLQRFYESARAFRMQVPFELQVLHAAHIELIRKNQLDRAYLRPIAFYGDDRLGLLPTGIAVHVAIAAWSWDAYLGADANARGIRAKTSSFARPPASAGLTRAKIASLYATSILAKTEAVDAGFDEALLLDSQGFVAEASGENVFLVKRGQLIEPEPSAALLGITRDSVLELARDLGLSVLSRRVTRDDIYAADEAFLTGTAAELVPVIELDRRVIGSGRPGPITARLQQAYSDAVHGRDPKHQEWLTDVS